MKYFAGGGRKLRLHRSLKVPIIWIGASKGVPIVWSGVNQKPAYKKWDPRLDAFRAPTPHTDY